MKEETIITLQKSIKRECSERQRREIGKRLEKSKKKKHLKHQEDKKGKREIPTEEEQQEIR